MKKVLLFALLSAIVANSSAYAQDNSAMASLVNKQNLNQKSTDNELTNINLEVNKENKPVLQIREPIKKVDGQLFESNEEKMQKAFEIQKKMDIDDIRNLWESTVERNSIIKFALKKLAMPPEQRRIHSSIMAKSVSTLISGASIIPNVLGADSIATTAALAGGSLANRVLSSKTMPKEMPLTDTELIQLAGLIESLQNKIIKSYYDYKSSLDALKVCRQNISLQNKNYSDAIQSNNEIAIITISALYDKELYTEMKLKQEIKQYRLELERLAGTETVSKLNLTKLTSLNSLNPEQKSVTASENSSDNKGKAQ